ncbi:MAG TPA: transposase [Balneolaceae bacterium]|nr:transposase [Balneolaceae bacterium]
MQFEKDYWYHVYNRGNNRQKIFYGPENYLFFLKKIRTQLLPYTYIVTYCLMPNHFHFLLKIKDTKMDVMASKQHPLAKKLGVVLGSYAQAINKQENRTGSLFQARTKSKNLSKGDRNYALTCFHYIHQNPVAANLVKNIEDWEFSSYRDYAGLRNGSLPAKGIGYKAFSIKDENHFIEQSRKILKPELIKKIF